jgi:hypothetical protein
MIAAVILCSLAVACSSSPNRVVAPTRSTQPPSVIVIGGRSTPSTSTPTAKPLPAPSPSTTIATRPPAPVVQPASHFFNPVQCNVKDGVPVCSGWRIGGPERPASQWWSAAPVAAPLDDVAQVVVGIGTVCAGRGDIDNGQGTTPEGRGELWCWGEGIEPAGFTGQRYRRIEEPVMLHAGDDLDAIAVGYRTVCAVFGAELICWGNAPGGWATTGHVVMSDVSLAGVAVTPTQVRATLLDGSEQVFNIS